jgi:hypothetical protein
MDSLNFDKLSLELINDNTSGEKYLSITPSIKFSLNKSLVLDSDSNNGFIKVLQIKSINHSLELLKKQIITEIYKKSKELYGKQKELNVIRDYYCDVKRLYLFNNNYEEIILVNNKNDSLVHTNSYIEGTIEINKIWVSGKTYGPVFDLINFNQVTDQNTNDFLNDSDNDSIIEYDF